MSGNVVAHVAMLSTVTALPRSRVPARAGRFRLPASSRRSAGSRFRGGPPGAAVPRGWPRAAAVASAAEKRKGAAPEAPPL